MRSLLAVVTAAGLLLGGVDTARAATIQIGGFSFDENAFADTLIASTGDFTVVGGTLAGVLTDTDPGTYAYSFDAGASVTLGFTDNVVVNGPGHDLALFELGTPDTFQVTLNGITRSYLSAATGFTAGGFDLLVALVDLSDFGLSPDATIDQVVIGLDTLGASSTVPSLSLVGALNSASVPEPATLLLFGAALAGAAARRRATSRR